MQLKSKYVKIVCSVLMAVAPLLQPLYVSADTITSANVIGTNVYTEPISSEYIASTNNNAVSNSAIVHIEILLDDSYLGWINLGVVVKFKNYYYGANPAYWGDTSKTFSGNYYLSGNSINIDVPISWNSQQLGYQMGSPTHLPDSSSDLTISITNQSNVVKMADLETLGDILDVLQNLPEDVRQWYFPVESFTAISRFMNQSFIDDGTYEIIDYHVFNQWTFPLIKINVDNFDYQNATIYKQGTNAQDKIYFVVCTNMAHVSYFNQFFQITGGGSIVDQQTITRFNMPNPDTGTSQVWGIYRYTISYTTGSASTSNIHIRTATSGKNPFYMIPIYFGYSQSTPLAVSTDFALQFGLSNSLLDDISSIAQGTTQSNQSASSESAANQQFASDSQELMDLEDTMSSNMDANLQQIDTSFDVGNTFGSKFLTSAQWVRNQFNTITNNTPFGTFISFSLLIGLSLLLVGKFL